MGSRRIVGFALGARHDAALAYGALAMAVAVRGGAVPGVVFHTDQGSEYTAGSFRAACERLEIAQSMGLPGSALDNAVIESWHSTLEFELRSLRSSLPGRRQDSGGGVDRGLQPCPPALRARDAQPGGLRAVAGGKGRRVTAAGPLRGPGKGGGCAAAGLAAPAKGTGPPLRPPGCCASPGGRRPCGPPLTPETPRPRQEKRAGHRPAPPEGGRTKASPCWARSRQPKSPRLEGNPGTLCSRVRWTTALVGRRDVHNGGSVRVLPDLPRHSA